MSNSQFKHTVIEVISYGRFFGLLNPAECILLHQWAQLNVSPNTNLKAKCKDLQNQIKALKWERPEFIYDTQLKLTYRTSTMQNFEAVPNEY